MFSLSEFKGAVTSVREGKDIAGDTLTFTVKFASVSQPLMKI